MRRPSARSTPALALPAPGGVGSRRGSFASARNAAAPTRVDRAEDAREFLAGAELDVGIIAPTVERTFMSAFIRARTPSA